jgi:hypothetical protein
MVDLREILAQLPREEPPRKAKKTFLPQRGHQLGELTRVLKSARQSLRDTRGSRC